MIADKAQSNVEAAVLPKRVGLGSLNCELQTRGRAVRINCNIIDSQMKVRAVKADKDGTKTQTSLEPPPPPHMILEKWQHWLDYNFA